MYIGLTYGAQNLCLRIIVVSFRNQVVYVCNYLCIYLSWYVYFFLYMYIYIYNGSYWYIYIYVRNMKNMFTHVINIVYTLFE